MRTPPDPTTGPWNPFPSLAHLQITFTPTEYAPLLQSVEAQSDPPVSLIFMNTLRDRAAYRHKLALWEAYSRQATPRIWQYWDQLPRYVVARCPFCATPYSEPLDTHSLSRWVFHPNRQDAVLADGRAPIARIGDPGVGCAHLFAVHTFLNRNGTATTDIGHYDIYREDIPYVRPEYLPHDMDNIAVMTSFPVCRIEADRFVPRHLVYTLAYYGPEGLAFRERELAQPQYQLSAEDSAGFASIFNNPGWRAYDLPYWVQHGRLQWLDPTSPDLALRAGPVAAFPYGAIIGTHGAPRPPLWVRLFL
ncbi:MAG TPA: hypothetical protein VKY74_15165 [Chloroflexia bacterium]|nr:hypothetical protein [Chloroflexia bacterium]